MKAYVTSSGEKTTLICCEQLTKFGFDVVLLDANEPWLEKFKRFINEANEDCLRIDADIVPNKNIMEIGKRLPKYAWMEAYTLYDLYRNGLYQGSPIFYMKQGIEMIRSQLLQITDKRPEASAWRLKETNHHKSQSDLIVGIHGFFQSKEGVNRAEENKKMRHQISQFDFELTKKLMKL